MTAYAEETYEEVQPDGTIVLRKTIVPVLETYTPHTEKEKSWSPTIIQIWGDDEQDTDTYVVVIK